MSDHSLLNMDPGGPQQANVPPGIPRTSEFKSSEDDALYISLVEQLPQSIFRKDRAGVFTFANRRFCEQLGRNVTDVLGKKDADLFPPELAEKYRQDDLRIMESGKTWSDVERHHTQSGGELYVEVVKFPLYNASGQIAGIQGIFWDVTERHYAVMGLRASEARLKEAERLAHLGSWETVLVSLEDVSQNPISWSDETYRIFGYRPGEVTVTRDLFVQHIHPEDRPKVQKAIETALKECRAYDVEHRVVRQDGSVRVVLEQAELECDPSTGRPRKFIGTVQDVTASRRLLKQIEGISHMRESLLLPGSLETKLKNITDSVVAIFEADFVRIWITRKGDLCESGCVHAPVREGPHVCRSRDRCLHLVASSGRYTHTDGAQHRRVPLGAYKIGKVAAGNNPSFITNNVTQDPQVHNHTWAKELGLAAFAGYRLISNQGEPIGVFALFHKHPISAGEDALLTEVATTASQVIQESHKDEARSSLEAQLRQAQKMEAIGRLAGGVAHDFNNMLQVILGNVDLALSEPSVSLSLRESLVEIQKSARHSVDLTRQLLAFARKQTISPQVLNLNDTVSGMLRMLQRLIGEDIQLRWIPAPDLWLVRMDPGQVDQILANLAVNARDAIQADGQVTIETRNVTLDAASTSLHPDCLPGDYVMLSVSDNGCGIDDVARAHIFEPFFTTKELGKGTGLGLATVFGIVKQNNGFINVDSKVGSGSVFKLFLPKIESEPAANKAPLPGRTLRGTETVLLVEDEPQILSLGQRILEQYGYTVLAVRTPAAALALAKQHHRLIDLLITDVVMPGINGKELKQLLTAIQPGLKCLFMSGYTADIIAHHGVLDKGLEFLQKPFTAETLAKRVRQLLESKAES